MAKIAVAVHACGFESENQICGAFESRLARTYELLCLLRTPRANDETIIIITGGVPYKNRGVLLAHCAGYYFKRLFPEKQSPYPIFYADNCYNSSTDTQNVLRICREQEVKRIIVVTSYWHNWMVRQMYKHWNTGLGPRVEFAGPRSRDGAGLKTILKYVMSGTIVLASRTIGLFNWLDAKLNKSQVKRQEEFQEIGCD